jgi:prevent-host-death family protein
MTKFVSLYEARTNLPDLVDRAAAGEEIVIARNGMPFARLVPLPNRGQLQGSFEALNVTPMARGTAQGDRDASPLVAVGE